MIKLKNILSEIVAEARKRKRGSGTVDWVFELDGLHIPGICLPTDALEISVVIDYNFTPGTPAKGMFGRPEDSSPAEDDEIEILGHTVQHIKKSDPNGVEKRIYYEYLIPQQQEIIDKAIDKEQDRQEDSIEDQIRNQEED